MFAFATAIGPNKVDTISDFGPVHDDLIALDDATFTQVGPVEQLSGTAFFVGTAAHDATDRIIYNASTGPLLYDADGTGTVAAVRHHRGVAGDARLTTAESVVSVGASGF